MVMAALGSGFVNVGAGEVADLGQMFWRERLKRFLEVVRRSAT